jgi:3-oxoacyl-(acyl-carrier-protein) synthase
VIGEGAAMFVLESADHAAQRGARPLARIAGWGSAQDPGPTPAGGAASAIERALAHAQLAPDALGYVHAPGSGSRRGDPAACHALHRALGPHARRVPVSSIRGAVGHLMAAAGAIELAATLLAFSRDLLPGTAHHDHPDEDCDVAVIGPVPRRARIEHALVLSSGDAGEHAAIVVGRA